MPLTFTQITQYQKSGFNSNHTTSLTPVEINGYLYDDTFYPNTNTLPNATLFDITPSGPSNIVDIQLTQSPLNLNQGDEGTWVISTDDLSISGYKGFYASDWRYNADSTLCTKTTNPLYRTNLDPNALNYGPNWPAFGLSTTGLCCNTWNNNVLRNALSEASSEELFAPTPFQSQISANLPTNNVFTHYKRFLKTQTINNGDQFDDGSQGVAFSNNIQWFEDDNGELTGRGFSPDDNRYYVLDETQTAANKWDSRVKEVVMFNSFTMVSKSTEPFSQANFPAGQDMSGVAGNKVFVVTILEPGVSIYNVNSPSGNGVSADNETTITIDIDGDAKFIPGL
tara:strand:+ start:82 stop:1098 length:1017 start_codon:yes stop_codon:yes gene_type:complete